ncbi:MAG: hypothetical protein ACJ735_12995 [Actinomycetes bacterium]
MTEPEASTPSRKPSPFAAVAALLVTCILICGVFAGLAGKKIGNKDADFIVSFLFLGLVVLLIFGLAWVDASTRDPDHAQRHH